MHAFILQAVSYQQGSRVCQAVRLQLLSPVSAATHNLLAIRKEVPCADAHPELGGADGSCLRTATSLPSSHCSSQSPDPGQRLPTEPAQENNRYAASKERLGCVVTSWCISHSLPDVTWIAMSVFVAFPYLLLHACLLFACSSHAAGRVREPSHLELLEEAYAPGHPPLPGAQQQQEGLPVGTRHLLQAADAEAVLHVHPTRRDRADPLGHEESPRGGDSSLPLRRLPGVATPYPASRVGSDRAAGRASTGDDDDASSLGCSLADGLGDDAASAVASTVSLTEVQGAGHEEELTVDMR